MRIRVCWTGEGTYPFNTGGVSTWADLLVHNLKNIDFIIMPVQMTPFETLKFPLPQNVIDLINIPLWGSEEPVGYIKKIHFSKIYANKVKTNNINQTGKFIPILINLLKHIYRIKDDMDELGEDLYQFYEYFQQYDYYETFKKEEIWYAYRDFYEKHFKDEKENIPTLFDMIEGLRYLFRFFIILLPTIPYADIYHSSAAAFCGLPCIIAKKKHRSKFLLTEHGIYIREQYLAASRNQMPYRTKEFLMGLITTVSKLNYHFADVISPVCNYNSRWELEWGAKKERIKTIYNGVDVDRFKKLDVQKNDRPTVVMVARIDPLKDIETFIYTADLVRKEIKNVLFKLYGPVVNEKYYKKCKKLVKELNLEKNFEFAGKTNSAELAYNEGDVVMLTSISEAFPFVVLEAMSCEKVVISSDVGGTKEVLEGYGYVVKPKDYKEFANKTIYLLKNPEIAKEMGKDARERVLIGFTIEDMIVNYEREYRKLHKELKDG
jgi:glycosyltransferase involved in cell wall biosynthesis